MFTPKELFSPTQLGIYEDEKMRIFNQLDTVYTRSNSNTNSLIGFFLQLKVTLKYERVQTDYMGKILYDNFPEIKLFFSELSDLLHANVPEHLFIKSICDFRFIPQENNNTQYKKSLEEEFNRLLMKDINQWYNDKLEYAELEYAKLKPAELKPEKLKSDLDGVYKSFQDELTNCRPKI